MSKNVATIEIQVKGQSRSFKEVQFDRLHIVSYIVL